jgi:hypothetical protein
MDTRTAKQFSPSAVVVLFSSAVAHAALLAAGVAQFYQAVGSLGGWASGWVGQTLMVFNAINIAVGLGGIALAILPFYLTRNYTSYEDFAEKNPRLMTLLSLAEVADTFLTPFFGMYWGTQLIINFASQKIPANFINMFSAIAFLATVAFTVLTVVLAIVRSRQPGVPAVTTDPAASAADPAPAPAPTPVHAPA